MQITASQYLNNSNTDKHYTSVFHYTRPTRGKYHEYIEMYGLLSVKSDVDIPGANITKFAWDGIVDGFEYSKAESVNDALKVSLTEATRRIKQLIANDKNISENGIDINFSIFVCGDSGMYVAYLGECDIYVYKDGKIVDIYEMLSKKGAKTAGIVLDTDDIIFSSTSPFFKKHINELIGLPDKEHILRRIDKIAEQLENSEGVLIFTAANGSVKTNSNIQKGNKDTESIQKEDTSHLEKNGITVFLPKNIEIISKNIRETISFLKSKLPKLSINLTPVWINIKNILSKILFWVNLRISPIFEKLSKKRWFKKTSAKISQSGLNIPRGRGFKSFKVDGYRVRNKKIERFKIFFVAIIVITLLVLGVRFTINEREARRVSKEANEIFKSVNELITSAESKKTTDKDASETLIFKAENELKKVPEGLREKDIEQLNNLQNRTISLQDEIYKRKGLSDSNGSLETYIGTRLSFGEGSNPSDIAIYQDNKGNEYLLVSDTGLKAVFRISLYNKEIQRVPDPDKLLQSPGMIYIGEKGLYIMDLNVGVLRAEFDENGFFKPITKLTALGIESFKDSKIAEFAVLTDADNIYVLDRNRKALLKANSYESGYGSPYEYIKDDALANANDIFADLSTYILTSGEDGLRRYIFSYREGKLVLSPLEIIGLNGGFKNLEYGYTRVDLNFDLYLYDSEEERILRFEKPIEGGGQIRHPNQALLKNQYVYRGDRKDMWKNVRDLVVTRDQKILYILDSDTIWKISL